MGSTLRLNEVARSRSGGAGLQKVSLEVEAGECVAVIGPAGSGKSMLVDLLAGLDRPDKGSIDIDGMPLAASGIAARGLGVMRQGGRLFPALSVAENIGFPLSARRVGKAERARLVEASLDLWQLTETAGSRPAALAPAERQRALIARATVFAPELLLLDEPFSEQESVGRHQVAATLDRLRRMLGMTTILATREAGDALALADRIAVLRQGFIEQVGTPDDIYERPRSPFVAGMLGDLNCLPGVVRAVDGDDAEIGLDCGAVVQARAAQGLASGQRCTLCLRPERIALVPGGGAGGSAEMGEFALEATLIDEKYFGDHRRLRLLIGAGAELVVKRPAAIGLRGLAPGGAATVAWQAHHAIAFRAGR